MALLFDLVVTGSLLSIACLLVATRLSQFQLMEKLGLDIFVHDALVREPPFSTKASKDRHAQTLEKENSMGMLDIYAEVRDVLGPWAQLLVLDAVDTLERVRK